MGKKGMSADDKKATIVKLLQEAKRPFTLKEVEKLAAKAGVVQNTVKDVVKELTDENLVDCDKIGSTNWFWSFPSKETAALRAKVRVLQEKQTQLDGDIARLQERKEELLRDRPMTAERQERLAKLEELKACKAGLDARLANARENDPEEARKLQRAVTEAKASANRWTDNTWSTVDWLKKSCGMTGRDAQRQLGVTEDFDYPVYVAGAAPVKKVASFA